MAFRFIHTADIHLDSPLRSLALRDQRLADLIGNATREAFTSIIDLCLEERVDALMIAGDLYDGEQTSMKTAGFLGAQMRRLDEAGISTFVIRGNHDALSKITKELTLPASVKIYSGRADHETIERAAGVPDVVVHGLSYRHPQAPDSLLERYSSPVEDAVNIGLMHTSLAGAPGHDTYAPCRLSDLISAGYDYWGLGHVHKRQVHSDTPAVVMPGMPQGRDINEDGAKSVTLVTIADDRSIRLEERQTSIAQFERISIDLTNIDDWREMVLQIEEHLGTARGLAVSRHLVARLSIVGQTTLAWRLLRDADLLKAEADDRAEAVGNTWVEKIEISSRSPVTDAVAEPGNPLTELRGLIAKDIAETDGFRTRVSEMMQELSSQLPSDCRNILGEDEASAKAMMQRIIAEGSEEVLARLHASPSEDAEAG